MWFSENDLLNLGAVLKCAPPVRHASELKKLWDMFEHIDILGSDHSPAPPSLKTDSNFFKIWGAVAVETQEEKS